MGRHGRHVTVGEDHPPLRGPVDAGDAVEERGLAGAVRTDDAHDALALDADVDALEGLEAAEVLGQVFGLKKKHKATISPQSPRSTQS